VPQVYNNSMRVTEPSRFFVLDASVFAELMHSWFPMAVHLLEGLFFGQKNTQAAIGQRERLLALGSLSAGLTHELNNPAAAAVRATSSLRERVAGMRHKLGMVASAKYDRDSLQAVIRLQEEVAERVPKAPVLEPLEASDREDAIGDWLEEHGVAGGWSSRRPSWRPGWTWPGSITSRRRSTRRRSRARCGGCTTPSRPNC
jgi:signal transduction histidine kinase